MRWSTTIGPAAALAGAVTEAGATDTTGMPTASGALMLLDADSTEVPGGSYAFASGASGTGLYGDLTLNANGTWSYMLDNGAPATEALAGGAEERDTFDIEGSLGHHHPRRHRCQRRAECRDHGPGHRRGRHVR